MLCETDVNPQLVGMADLLIVHFVLLLYDKGHQIMMAWFSAGPALWAVSIIQCDNIPMSQIYILEHTIEQCVILHMHIFLSITGHISTG